MSCAFILATLCTSLSIFKAGKPLLALCWFIKLKTSFSSADKLAVVPVLDVPAELVVPPPDEVCG